MRSGFGRSSFRLLPALALASLVSAQEPTSTPEPDVPRAPGSAACSGSHLGLDLFGLALPGIRLGPLCVRPSLRIDGIGWDTNVFLESRDRNSDFYVRGGPGLTIDWPLTTKTSLVTSGALQYLWYAKNESQRRRMGSARSALVFTSSIVRFSTGYQYSETFEQPNPQIGRRIQQKAVGPIATVGLSLPGRLQLAVNSAFESSQTPQGANSTVAGNDLSRRLSRDSLKLDPTLSYGLTVKTSLMVAGRWDRLRFEREPTLDSQTLGWRAGIRTDDTSLLPAEILFGIDQYRPETGQQRNTVSGEASVRYARSARTRLVLSYQRGRSVSLLQTVGSSQTAVQAQWRLEIDKALVSNRLDLRLSGLRSGTQVDGGQVLIDQGSGLEAVNGDEIRYQALANLGYRLGHFRVGIEGNWQNRATTPFSTLGATATPGSVSLGIKGVIFGMTIAFTP